MDKYTKKINQIYIGFKDEDLTISSKSANKGYPEQYRFLKEIKETDSKTNLEYLKEAESKIFQEVKSSDSKKKESKGKEITVPFKYGEVVPITRPKVLISINPFSKKLKYDDKNEEERRRKVLFKILFDSYAFVDGKVDNLFIPLFFSSSIKLEVWYHLVYNSLSRYLQVNYESNIKSVVFYYVKEELEDNEDRLSNLTQYLKTIEDRVEVSKIQNLIPRKAADSDDDKISEKDEESSEDEDSRERDRGKKSDNKGREERKSTKGKRRDSDSGSQDSRGSRDSSDERSKSKKDSKDKKSKKGKRDSEGKRDSRKRDRRDKDSKKKERKQKENKARRGSDYSD